MNKLNFPLFLWAFHPNFITWLLVVFGDQVTKILCNSLLTFFTEQGKTGKTEIWSKENQATKMTQKTINEVIKICNEPGICPNNQIFLNVQNWGNFERFYKFQRILRSFKELCLRIQRILERKDLTY